MIALYAIAEDPGPPLPDVAPLRAVTAAGLAAVCAEAPDERPEPTAEALWRHEEVVEALMADRDVLPVRYGTTLPDEAGAQRVLAARRDELAAGLERIRGAVEVSLRVLTTEPPDAGEAASGTEYLRARARGGRTREAMTRRLHDPLAAHARDAVLFPPKSPAELLRAAYLVERPLVDRLVGAVSELARQAPDLRMVCTGPWPPYSFAER